MESTTPWVASIRHSKPWHLESHQFSTPLPVSSVFEFFLLLQSSHLHSRLYHPVLQNALFGTGRRPTLGAPPPSPPQISFPFPLSSSPRHCQCSCTPYCAVPSPRARTRTSCPRPNRRRRRGRTTVLGEGAGWKWGLGGGRRGRGGVAVVARRRGEGRTVEVHLLHWSVVGCLVH